MAARGQVRSQFCHAIDLLPTILDAVGIAPPDEVDGVPQQQIDGASLRHTFDDADAPAPRSTQYFEMLGSRSIYHDGWKATTDHVGAQLSVERERVAGSHNFDRDHWALFRLDDDPAEARDLSGEEPDRARRLVELWWIEAGRNQVLPLEDGFISRASALEPSRWQFRARAELVPGGGPVSETMLPPMMGGFRLSADIEVGSAGAHGVVVALGDWHNGWALYVLDGRPVACVNRFGEPFRAAATRPLGPGRHAVEVLYRRAPGGGGPLALRVDGELLGETRITGELPFRWQIGGTGALVGHDRGFPVCDDYRPPAPFSGTIERVVLEPLFMLPADVQAEIEALLKRE
jgi:arylsulfatase